MYAYNASKDRQTIRDNNYKLLKAKHTMPVRLVIITAIAAYLRPTLGETMDMQPAFVSCIMPRPCTPGVIVDLDRFKPDESFPKGCNT